MGAGVCGGWLFSTQVCGVDSLHYWNHTEEYIGSFELFSGVVKSIFFGAAIAVVSCHRGFNCTAAGALKASAHTATEAFVYSFVAILTLDFFLGIVTNAPCIRGWETLARDAKTERKLWTPLNR